MTFRVSDLLKEAEMRLSQAGVHHPPGDAEAIVAYLLQIPRAEVCKKSSDFVLYEQKIAFTEILQRRCARVPLSRITGGMPFAGVMLELADNVFEPMVESESLIEHAVLAFEHEARPLRILDIGTGSGALLLAALHALPHATGVGIDIDEKALALAGKNAERNGLQARAAFQHSAMGQKIAETFDLVLSNPPHVPHGLIPHLLPEVRAYNPGVTLDGGRDGMDYFKIIAKRLPALLKPDGYCFLQAALKTHEKIVGLFTAAGFSNVSVRTNAYGVPVAVAVRGAPFKRKFLGIF